MKQKRAIIIVELVPEANNEGNRRLAKDIKRTLKCDWLARIRKTRITEVHHELPSGKERLVFEKPA
jgi:hypothetical protein